MPKRDIVVVGASAGGIEALREVLAGIDPSFDGIIAVVLHIPAEGGHSLPRILDKAGPLTADGAVDGEALQPGRVYVCRADHHLLLGDGRVRVRRGPRENGHRPAVDPLFRSAARYYGTRSIGVVLSGTLSDGTAGLGAIRRAGGLAVVQEPSDALYDGMPSSAIDIIGADHIVPAAALGPLLSELAQEHAPGERARVDERVEREVAFMEGDEAALDDQHPGTPSPWPCPDCSGVLWQIDEDPVLRFRCRVGHAWGAESLLHEQGHEVEAALWVALRSLEDRAALSHGLAERAEEGGRSISARRFRSEVEEMDRSIATLRHLLHGGGAAAVTGSADRG